MTSNIFWYQPDNLEETDHPISSKVILKNKHHFHSPDHLSPSAKHSKKAIASTNRWVLYQKTDEELSGKIKTAEAIQPTRMTLSATNCKEWWSVFEFTQPPYVLPASQHQTLSSIIAHETTVFTGTDLWEASTCSRYTHRVRMQHCKELWADKEFHRRRLEQ